MSFCSTNSGGFVEHLSLTKVAQQSETKIIYMTLMNLVTTKAAAKHELLFKKPATGENLKVALLPLAFFMG